jgi:PPOX class probable F420-dependent enzyme
MPDGVGDVADPMSNLTMPADVRESFLAEPRVGVLSIAREPGAPPLSTPVWYLYEPGGEVVVSIGRTSEKARLLDASPFASLCVQSEALPYRFVTVSGPVEVGPVDQEVRRTLAARYLPADRVEGYLASGDPDASVTVRLTPAAWFSNDYSRFAG